MATLTRSLPISGKKSEEEREPAELTSSLNAETRCQRSQLPVQPLSSTMTRSRTRLRLQRRGRGVDARDRRGGSRGSMPRARSICSRSVASRIRRARGLSVAWLGRRSRRFIGNSSVRSSVPMRKRADDRISR
jgi:hypothetical protein